MTFEAYEEKIYLPAPTSILNLGWGIWGQSGAIFNSTGYTSITLDFEVTGGVTVASLYPEGLSASSAFRAQIRYYDGNQFVVETVPFTPSGGSYTINVGPGASAVSVRLNTIAGGELFGQQISVSSEELPFGIPTPSDVPELYTNNFYYEPPSYTETYESGGAKYRYNETSNTHEISTLSGLVFINDDGTAVLQYEDWSVGTSQYVVYIGEGGNLHFTHTKFGLTLQSFDLYDSLNLEERTSLVEFKQLLDADRVNIQDLLDDLPTDVAEKLQLALSNISGGQFNLDGSLIPNIKGFSASDTSVPVNEAVDEQDIPKSDGLDGSSNTGPRVQTFGLGGDDYGNQDLYDLLLNGPQDSRVKAFGDLYKRALADDDISAFGGVITANLNGGGFFKVTTDAVGRQVISLYAPGADPEVEKPLAQLVTQGDNQFLQIVPGEDTGALIELLNENSPLQKLAISRMEIADDYYNTLVGKVGDYVAGFLADKLADDSFYQQVLYSALFKTISDNFDTFTSFLAAGVPVQNALNGILSGQTIENPTTGELLINNNFLEDFTVKFSAAAASAIAGTIVTEIGEGLGLEGITSDVFDIVGGALVTPVVTQAIDYVFDVVSLPTSGNTTSILDGDFNFEAIQAQVFMYIGKRFANEIVSPESAQAAKISAIYTTIDSFFAAPAYTNPITAAFYTFFAQIRGNLIGNLFASHDEPAAWANIYFDKTTGEYTLGNVSAIDGGDAATARGMAEAVIDGVNNIIEMTGGALRFQASAPKIFIGYDGGEFQIGVNDHVTKVFDRSGLAIEQAAFELLKGFDLVGGHAILMRAWHNSTATNLEDFKEDLQVAEAFQNYLLNPTGIIALMMNDPESQAAQAWAAILQKAAALELHLPSEYDIDGGWGELLRARGDIDPNLIPDIDGNDIVLTDPVTGETIRLQHVIGPGYEIVRMPGTDGNDIIQVIVDGPSITYVDAGDGNDVIEGSEESDIILGGFGEDIINGNGGDDWLNGGPGDDIIDGGAGLDLIVGDYDDDILTGGLGQDSIHGGYGNDTIDGGEGSDYLYGGPGDDIIHAETSTSADLAFGEDGDDTLYGANKSKLIGGQGNDTYILSSGKNEIWVDRGEGHDTIEGINSTNPSYLVFHRTISINEIWLQRDPANTDDLQVLILGEKQSVTIKNFFASDANLRPNVDIYAHGGNLYLDRNNIISLVNKYTNLSDSPQGEYNLIDDAVLREATIYPQNHWQWAQKLIDSPAVEEWLTPGTGPYNTDANYTLTDTAGNVDYHYIVGADGNDSITSVDGDDIAFGGAGNDTINSSDSNNFYNKFYGDSGDDTIHGGNYGDTLVGGLGNDSLYGQGGKDILYGGYGNDLLDGGDSNDRLYGGAGDDTLNGGQGDNALYGGEGNDTFSAGTGNDLLEGEDGDDYLSSGGGDDVVKGGAGNDIIIASQGDDWIHGGEGNDELTGNQGNDTVYGGEGDDILNYILAENTGAEDDYDGGADDDTLRIHLTAAEFAQPGLESELIRYKRALAEHQAAGTLSTFTWTFALMGLVATNIEHLEVYVDGVLTNIGYNEINGTAGDDTLTGSAEHDLITGDEGNDTISGTAGDDDLQGGLGNDTIVGGDGLNLIDAGDGDDIVTGGNDADTVYAGAGDDTVNAGAGDDLVYGQDGADTLNGEDGKDKVYGGFGDDVISGGAGDDELYGEADADIIDGHEGDDYIDGGSGDDILTGHEGDDTIKGGRGNDLIIGDFDMNSTYAGADKLYGEEGNDTIYGYKGDDLLDGGKGDDMLYGGDDNDTLYGGDDNDTLYGASGNDELHGDAGNDDLRGSDGDDLIYGGTGDDYIEGGDQNDTVYGEAGNDNISGGDGDDILSGGSGDDVIGGYAGNDTIIGGAGADTLSGGLGADTFVIDADSFDGNINLVEDFSLSDGDVLGFQGILNAVDFENNVIGNFVSLSETVAGTDVLIDRDGLGTDHGFDAAISLNGVFGADAQTLFGSWGDGLWNIPVVYDLTQTLSNTQTYLGTQLNEHYILSGSDNIVDIQRGDGHDLIEADPGSTNYIRFYRDIGTNELWFKQKGDDLEILVLGENQSVRVKDWFTSGTRPDFEIWTYGGNIVATQENIDQLVSAYATMPEQPSGPYNTLSDSAYLGNGETVLNNMYGDGSFLWRFGDSVLASNATEKFVTPLGSNFESTPAEFDFDTGYSLGDTNADYDYFVGANGNDNITSNSGNDLAFGGAGNDVIDSNSSSSVNRFFGDSGNDTLYGGGGNDVLVGGLGDDIIWGEDGDDSLWGSAGDDEVYGGNGNDVLSGGAGADLVNGGAGTDILTYIGSSEAVSINLKTGVNQGGDAEGDQILKMETIIGSRYDDSLTGSDNADTLKGSYGSDTIRGNAGNDTFYGDEGDDFIYLGDGTNQIYGGAGADTFVMDGGSFNTTNSNFANVDYINDFNMAEGDALKVEDVLIGYDPLTSAIEDFVQLAPTSAGDTRVYVDFDGSGSAYGWKISGWLEGVNVSDEQSLLDNGNLIIQTSV